MYFPLAGGGGYHSMSWPIDRGESSTSGSIDKGKGPAPGSVGKGKGTASDSPQSLPRRTTPPPDQNPQAAGTTRGEKHSGFEIRGDRMYFPIAGGGGYHSMSWPIDRGESSALGSLPRTATPLPTQSIRSEAQAGQKRGAPSTADSSNGSESSKGRKSEKGGGKQRKSSRK